MKPKSAESEAVAADKLGVGTVIDQTYQIERLMGEGGMGSVWLASHLRLSDRQVAIKFLHAEAADDDRTLGRFRREAEIACKLDHPRIVQVLDYNVTPGGQPYIVMERLEGESLADRIDNGGLIPWAQTRLILMQLCDALAAAHDLGVVHRDLKPDNIFLLGPKSRLPGESVSVKVLDFGISKVLGSKTQQTQTGTIMGTPHYMAPEQAAGKVDVMDHRVDIFAFGAIAAEMLNGQLVFPGETLTEIIYKISFGELPDFSFPADVPERATTILRKTLEKDPADRYDNVRALRQALEFADHGGASSVAFDATLAPGTPAPDLNRANVDATSAPAVTPQASSRFLVLAGMFALVVGLIVVGVLFFGSQGPERASDMSITASDGVANDVATDARANGKSVRDPQNHIANGDVPSDAGGDAQQEAQAASTKQATKRDPHKAVRASSKSSASSQKVPAVAQAAWRTLQDAKRAKDWKKVVAQAAIVQRLCKSAGDKPPPVLRKELALAYCQLGKIRFAKSSYKKLNAAQKRQVRAKCELPQGYVW